MSTESTDPVEPPKSVEPEATPEAPEATSETPGTPDPSGAVPTVVPGAPAPAKPKPAWPKFVIVGVLALALIGAGTYLITSLNSYAAGDCVSAKPNDDDAGTWSLDSAGCGDASYKIAKMLPENDEAAECPEVGIYEQVKVGKQNMCLMPNLVEGNCYGTDDHGGFKKENCSPESTVKIVKKVSGNPENQEGICPEPSSPLPFAEPAEVYCMGVQE